VIIASWCRKSEWSIAWRQRLHKLGVRGVRFFMFPGGVLPWDILEPMSARLAEIVAAARTGRLHVRYLPSFLAAVERDAARRDAAREEAVRFMMDRFNESLTQMSRTGQQ